jgi:hypothetical protein
LFELLSPYAAWFRNGLTGQSPVEQLTSGHISPFNDGQGFFAQFDPSKEPRQNLFVEFKPFNGPSKVEIILQHI